MSEGTPLDRAHAAMQAGGGVDRLRFYERVADAELFVMLTDEARGDQIEPQIYPVEGEQYVLVFDQVERLAEFTGQVTPYAALSGRAMVSLLAGQNIGLGINLGIAPSSILLPASAIDWLAQTLLTRSQKTADRPIELRPPCAISQEVLSGLNTKLALGAGLARAAYLAEVEYQGGRKSNLLVFVDARPGAEAALSQAVAEALVFSGVEADEIDVTFLVASDPICARLDRVGLRFDLPEPVRSTPGPSAPGMDPARPPKLR